MDNLPPGPKGYRLLQAYREFFKLDYLEFATRLTATYGDIVHLKLGFQHLMFFSNPKDVNQILLNTDGKYDKAVSKDIEYIASNSLNTLQTNDDFAEKSQTFISCLNNITIDEHEKFLNLELQKLFQKWDNLKEGENANISMDMLKITVFSMAELMLGINPGILNVEEINQYKYQIVTEGLKRSKSINKFPIVFNRKIYKAIKYKYSLVEKIVEESLKFPKENTYMSRLLMKYNIQAKPTLATIKKITGEILSVLYLGSDPSDKLLSWFFYYASMYPNEKAKLFDEIDAISKDHPITMSTIAKLPYTIKFLNEVLRLRTPYALIARVALKEDYLRGYTIPAGTLCAICPLLAHKHATYWKNPEAFNPERFTSTPQDNIAYIPFSSGSRPCLGKNFALRQTLYLLANILKRYDFELAPYRDYRILFLGVLDSQNDIQGTISKRKSFF